MVNILRHHGITQQGVNVSLHVLLGASSMTRHKIMMVEVGLVHELVEIELIVAEKRITELTLETLRVGTVAKLCMVLQVDHAKYLKDKVMEILKWHSEV
ncbi:E3 ubiquitin-protein ligase PUB24 [Glycine soja]|uniref:U-box domain-containing protein n=1 Tax=Glycine soja TaxID=3848 RepID=A0A0B2SV57_GLYSO|nr:E3 ubiquitin-protein ligase PUB24 [Glycine soja]